MAATMMSDSILLYRNMANDEDEQSPTDTSEDSVELSLSRCRRRKPCMRRRAGPAKAPKDDCISRDEPAEKKTRLCSPSRLAPKKRFMLVAMQELEEKSQHEEDAEDCNEFSRDILPEETSPPSPTPFRPWDSSSPISSPVSRCAERYSPVEINPLSLIGYQNPFMENGFAGQILPCQEEPLALVVTKRNEDCDNPAVVYRPVSPPQRPVSEKTSCSRPILPTQPLPLPSEIMSQLIEVQTNRQHKKDSPPGKGMTKDRRIEANKRERQRVHTITAAFDTLQAALPTEEENLKMSKLSVIKIATAYIMALSRMAGYDYTEDQSAPSVQEVIKHCQDVINMETKTKPRKS